jgi:hypothetical protein
MNITLQSDAMRELMQRLDKLNEADSVVQDAAANTESKPEAPETGTEDQVKDDTEIEDVMTEPKSSAPAKISLQTLASDLGLENTALFKSAFNQLRSGIEPTDQDQIRELASAFTKIMNTDTSTAQRVVNRLRMIYQKPLTGI